MKIVKWSVPAGMRFCRKMCKPQSIALCFLKLAVDVVWYTATNILARFVFTGSI